MNLSLKLEVGLGLDYVVFGSFVIKTVKNWKDFYSTQTDLRQSMSPKSKLLFYPLFCLFPYYHYLFLSKTNNE